jgi:hypothetical protein
MLPYRVEKRLHETAEVSAWFASGVHWLCKLCGHLDPAMRGKNWVDNADPGDERRVYGLGHEYCQVQARRIVEERRLAQYIAQRSFAGETELEAYLRASEDEAKFRATYPSYRGPWPIPLNSVDVSNAYMHGELREPDINDPPRAPEPAVKLEPELDPVPDAIGQPPFAPQTGRPTAYWDMKPASKHGEPIDAQACKYGDPMCTKHRPKNVSCGPCRLEHYHEHEVTHCENYCNNFTCMFDSPVAHSLDECVRCTEHPSCSICPHCITDERSCARIREVTDQRMAAKNGSSGRGGGGPGPGGGGGPGPGGGGGRDPGSGGDPSSGSGNGSEGSDRSYHSHHGRPGGGDPGGGDPGGGDPGGDDPGDGDFPEVDDAGGDGRERRDGRANGWPRSNQKQRDRDAAEFRKTAMGQSGQNGRTEFQAKGPGEVKLLAISYAKKLKLNYNASDPSVVRKEFIDLVAK